MTHPIAGFLDGLMQGAERGTAFRWARDDRRQQQAFGAEDREYERARRLREEVAFNLSSDVARRQLNTPRLTEVSPGASLYDPDRREPVYTAPPRPDDGPDPIVTSWQQEGFPSLEAWQAYHLRISRGGGGSDDSPSRFRPGTPEHRQAEISKRIRSLRRPDQYGEIPMSLDDATAEATAEYERQYPSPSRAGSSGWGWGGGMARPGQPQPRPGTGGTAPAPTGPRSGGPSPFMRPGVSPAAPTVPFEERARQLDRQFPGDLKRIADQLRREGYDFDE